MALNKFSEIIQIIIQLMIQNENNIETKKSNNNNYKEYLIPPRSMSMKIDKTKKPKKVPQAYLNAINAGEFDKAFNMLLSGPSATAANANRQNGLSFAGITMGNEDVFGGYNNNDLRRFTEAANGEKFQTNLQDNLNSIANGTNSL